MKCREVDNLLETYIDGSLVPELERLVHDHILDCPECTVKFEHAMRVTHELRRLPLQTCPESVVQGALARAKGKREHRFAHFVPSLRNLQPRIAWAAAAVLIIAVTLALYPPSAWFPGSTVPEHAYTDQEIAQAKEEILLALGYVNQATYRAHQMLEEEVFPNGVVKPFQKSLDYLHLEKSKGDPS